MSYNTVAESIAYFNARYGYDLWSLLDETEQQQALNSGQQILDLLCVWDGEKTASDQANAFPRDGDTEAPEAVKTSELEISYAIVDEGSTSTDGGDGLKKLGAGPVSLEWNASKKAGNPLVNGMVASLLGPLGQCDFNMGKGTTVIIPSYRG